MTEIDNLSNPKGFNNPATLVDLDTGKKYTIPSEPGEYSIGRKDNDSTAIIQIETKDKYMSKTHIGIRVQKTNNLFVYDFRIYKNAKNPIILDGRLLTYKGNDYIPLDKNQVIRFPYVKLRLIDDKNTKE